MVEIGKTITSFALPGNHTGKVLRKSDKKGYNNADLYEILNEEGQIELMVEALFDKEDELENETNIATDDNDLDIEDIEIQIENAINNIIYELGLEESNDIMVQLKNCCLVQKYIAEHNVYNEDIMDEKLKYKPEEIIILDLYNAVVLHSGVCTSNSLMFKKILEKLGVKVEVIGLISSETGGMHAANIVELNGDYYFFDSTLETTIYKENGQDGNIVLCCAGLGKNEYCQWYTPEVVLPDDITGQIKPLPENISKYRIPADIVNSFIKGSQKK